MDTDKDKSIGGSALHLYSIKKGSALLGYYLKFYELTFRMLMNAFCWYIYRFLYQKREMGTSRTSK